MKIIYHPKGKAGEYADFAANLYSGCPHGCKYCYAPQLTYRTREEFLKIKPRNKILDGLMEDMRYLQDYPDMCHSVFLCFSCDPYPPAEIEFQLTRQVIKLFHAFGIGVMILTKGETVAMRDFDILSDNDQFGVTLTCLNNADSLEWEPFASLPEVRMESLELAHRKGIKTWVSLEPVVNPATTLEIIRQTHNFVDMYKVGILNYHPLTQKIDWAKFGKEVVSLLESFGNKYYIKKDLQSYLYSEAKA